MNRELDAKQGIYLHTEEAPMQRNLWNDVAVDRIEDVLGNVVLRHLGCNLWASSRVEFTQKYTFHEIVVNGKGAVFLAGCCAVQSVGTVRWSIQFVGMGFIVEIVGYCGRCC